MADMNLSQQKNIFYSPSQSGYSISSKVVLRSIGHVFEPVFEFLAPSKEPETVEDYPDAISKQEMRNAEFQRIMGEKKSKFNIVI